MPLTSYDDQLLSPLPNIRDSVPESGPFCAGVPNSFELGYHPATMMLVPR